MRFRPPTCILSGVLPTEYMVDVPLSVYVMTVFVQRNGLLALVVGIDVDQVPVGADVPELPA